MTWTSSVLRYGAAMMGCLLAAALSWATGETSLLLAAIVLAGLYAGRSPTMLSGAVGIVALAGLLLVADERFALEGDPWSRLAAFAAAVALVGMALYGRATLPAVIQRAEHEARLVVESMPGLGWSADPDGNFRYLNRGVSDYTGWQAGGSMGFGGASVLHPEEVERVIAHWRHCLQTGEVYESEHRLRRHDGTYRWFRAMAHPSRDAKGRIDGWYGVTLDIDDRKKAEEALHAGEQRLQTILDNIPGMIAVADAMGRHEYSNRRLVDYLGRDLPDAQRHPWPEIIHPEDRKAVLAARQHNVPLGRPFEVSYRRRRHDGAYRWFQVRIEPVRDADGRIVRWYSLLIDVDEQRKAEEMLKARERELASIVECIPGMIATMDAGGNHVYASQRLLDYVGQDLSTLLEQGWCSVIHPEDRDAAASEWRRCVAAGESLDIVYRRRRHDGEYRWCHVRTDPLRDDEGQIVRWYSLLVDVHENKLAEEALHRSEQQLRLLIDTMPAMVWCASPNGDPFYLNQRMLDYAGLRAEDAGQFRYKLIHPDDIEPLKSSWVEAITKADTFRIVYRLRRADGVYRWHEGRAEPLHDADGRIAQWYGVNVDIHDRLQAEQALRSTQSKFQRASQLASLAELSASIAHEVNQPLAAVVTNSHACQRWLAADPPNIERARLTTQRIIRDANAAADVVSRVRALFKQSTGGKVPIDLNEVAAEVCELLADDIAAKQIRIETQFERQLPPVRADRVQIQQVLVNLIRNGIDAMEVVDGPRTLTIRSHRDGEEEKGGSSAVVEILDHGGGVEDTEKIFEPFFTTKSDGMGMGLAICRSIVEAHDGRLWADRIVPRGTAFTMVLPGVSERPA